MNRQRLLALRVQVAGVLASIDAELAADIESQAPLMQDEDDDMPVIMTMGQPDDG
jgi:hypothetical protein